MTTQKPDFPEPQLIREDFLPEQDPMRNYRIKKITKGDGNVRYYPQKKFLWFWVNLIGSVGYYDIEQWAQETIFTDYINSQKDKVEYLAPDIFKTPKSNPNPPPRVV